MADFITCDNKELGIEAILNLLIESDGSGGIILKTGAASGVAGGLSVYHNINDADFNVAPVVGTNTVTVTGTPFTMEVGNVIIGAAYVIDNLGNRIDLPIKTLLDITGDVITFGSYTGTFAATDEVIILMLAATKAYDTDLNGLLTSDLNPLPSHRNNQHLLMLLIWPKVQDITEQVERQEQETIFTT